MMQGDPYRASLQVQPLGQPWVVLGGQFFTTRAAAGMLALARHMECHACRRLHVGRCWGVAYSTLHISIE